MTTRQKGAKEVLGVQENNMFADYLPKDEAVKYLNINEDVFNKYTNEKSKIPYALVYGERRYSKQALDRFKKEVLQLGKIYAE